MFMPLSGHVSKTEGIMVDHHAVIGCFVNVESLMMGDGSLLLFLSSAQGKRYCVWGYHYCMLGQYVLCWYYWLRGGSIIMDNSFLFHYFLSIYSRMYFNRNHS
jgi:hypothetical protein